jgi:Putative redox-active protein (C_GCAxxG_C_C)
MDDILIRMIQLGQKGYNCSQIIMLLGLEVRGATNPQLVRAMGGLAYGCGTGRGSCGVLTGGCCLLALYAGKGEDGETPSERLDLMLQELNDWFAARTGCEQGGMSCDSIVGEAGPVASRQKCGALVAETYTKVMEILAANEIDPESND